MVKKAILLFTAAACFTGGSVDAQQAHCFTDEMHAKAKEMYPEKVAAAEAQLKAEIDAALGRMNIPLLKVTAGETWADTVTLRIPVVMHVIHNYGIQEYVSDDILYQELANINRLYRGHNPDTSEVISTYKGNIPGTSIKYIPNTHIQFYLAGKDPFGNPTTGITRRRDFSTTSAGNHAKFDLWPPQSYLNIWIVNAFDGTHANAAAYAYKPSAAAALPWWDGPITYMRNGFNFDNTMAHEIGHYLDLDHPWGGTNNPAVTCGDDAVDDTPPTEGHTPSSCLNLAAIYDTKCVLQSKTVGRLTVNNNNKVSDAIVGDGIKFRGLEKLYIDSVSFFPAVSGNPYTIVLKRKDASGQYHVVGTHSGVTNTSTNKQTARVRFFAPAADTVAGNFTSEYSLEFSVNPTAYRDLGSAYGDTIPTGTRGAIGNVLHFTNDTTGGRYNYFYDWHVRHGDYYVQYPPSVAKDLFNITTTGPITIDYPDTVNSQNVMDYTYCSKMFTYLQSVRMRAALRSTVASRDSLWRPYNLIKTGITNPDGSLAPRVDLPPVAEFSTQVGGAQSLGMGFTCRDNSLARDVVFTNRSWRDTVSRIVWNFSNGATNPSVVSNNPVINVTTVSNKFTDTGWVTVQMIAESNAGADTLVSSDRVYVADENGISPAGYFQEFNQGGDMGMYPIFNYFNNFTKWEVVNNAGFYDNTSIRYKQFDSRTSLNALTGTPRGDYDDFITRAFDLTGMGNTIYLTFFTAGAFRTNNPNFMLDELEISYTSNCGFSWQTLKTLRKGEIGNNGVVDYDWTPAGFWEWQPHNIAITATSIPENVRGKVFFRFRYKPGANPNTLIGTGNNFYLDRMHIGQWTTDVNDVASKDAGFTLAPNPTTGSTSVIIKDTRSNTARISITDVTGKLVYTTQADMKGDITRVEIPANYIAVKGMYLVTVTTGSHKQTEKLVVY